MSDPPHLSVPTGHLVASSRQYRSTSGSPTRQKHTDELLSQLSPATAIQAFRNPSGSLKRSLDAATPSEQSFAMRAALASKNIQEWLEELSQWPWPAESGSAGFEQPVAKRRKLLESHDSNASYQSSNGGSENSWMGSLLTADVARYDKRIDAIQRAMDELDVEEIKSHVLHHHILPLSRPGTPISDSTRPATPSLSTFNKMDDLTAIITAVVIQALPNLSRLIRLMNTWSVRLLVLKRVPAMLASLTDAEIAIQSGWNAIGVAAVKSTEQRSHSAGSEASTSDLTRKDFDVMKLVLEKKVSKAARVIDFMLDSLDGREDTIPDEWIDRMDNVEREYSEWVAACERKIREAEWKKMIRDKPVLSPPVRIPEPEVREDSSEPGRETGKPETDHPHSQTGNSTDLKTSDILEPGQHDQQHTSSQEHHSLFREPVEQLDFKPSKAEINVHSTEEQLTCSFSSDQLQGDNAGQITGSEATQELERPIDDGEWDIPSYDGLDDRATENGIPLEFDPADAFPRADSIPAAKNSSSDDDDDIPEPTLTIADLQRPAEVWRRSEEEQQRVEGGSELQRPLSSRDSRASLRSQPSLPSLDLTERRGSEGSAASTIVHRPTSGLDIPSDVPELGDTPELPRIRDVESTPRDDPSPPSSPPNFRSSTRSTVTFNDMPTVAEAPDDETSPKTPPESSFLDDSEIPRDIGSPSRMSVSSEDDQLQQQISEILGSISAKIHLSSQPSPINHLNPPDLQLPRMKPKQVDTVRSQSSMSSRAGTPSFLLAPAYSKNPRPRHQRGNQEIKLYHLSRSTGEAPIKLFIRLVGENGERVMVRVGGGWADLGEYLKEYASHHGRRSKNGGDSKIEIRDLPPVSTGKVGSSPPSRPPSAMDSPLTPLNVRKTRKSFGEDSGSKNPKTPLAPTAKSSDTPSSGTSTRSRSSSRLSWTEEDSSLGMSGPRTKNIEMSEESKAWVESVKEKVRIASGERKPSDNTSTMDGKFGEIGKVGGTKRLFRKG